MNFPNEEARQKAFNDLGDDPSKIEQLNEIREAKIVPESSDTTQNQDTHEEDTAKSTPTETPDNAAPDYAGHKSVDDLVKSHKELEATFARQGNKLREVLEQAASNPKVDQSVVERAERLQRELDDLKKQGPASTETTADIKTVQSDMQGIQAKLDELDRKAEADPDEALSPEFQKEYRSLTRKLTNKVSDLTNFLVQAKAEIEGTKKSVTEYSTSQKKTKEAEDFDKLNNALYESMDKLDDPEYKLPKPVRELEGEYIGWTRKVALAYYDRPAANLKEEKVALEQLQLKNPELMSKCQMMGINTDPGEAVNKYIKQCELLDYMDGYRKDPVTGKLKRLMHYDPISKTEVPIVCRDINDALAKKRLEEGYYTKKADGEYQKGAEDLANVAMRRDKGAVTLDGGQDQGQTPNGVDWAVKMLAETDEEKAMIEHRRGNNAKFDEIQKARSILGMDPIVFA
ncbi:MAG: hypothetical protein WC449_05945 [Candidatus Paceibacterota bacterium]